MATIAQIRGMLLEEVLLYLLRISGYRTVQQAGSDPTLKNGPAGLQVNGRGGLHQIDAIADYIVAHPFSHPQRLLVEAKCYADSYPVGIEKIRNAVGVLKDVEEFWVSRRKNRPFKKRYHYQYAVFSASDYTTDAEAYAYAQDIYLIPLARSKFVQPVIQAIRDLTIEDFGLAPPRRSVDLNLTELRRVFRESIQNGDDPIRLGELIRTPLAQEKLRQLIRISRRINQGILAMIARQIPVFLVPGPEINVARLDNENRVRIYWNDEGWYIREANTERLLFSFDLPPTLFELYAREGALSPNNALRLKDEYLRTIQAVITIEEHVRVITFNLDTEWLNAVREQTRKLANVE